MTWTTRDDLVLSIRMGLTKGLLLVHGMRRKLSIDERDTISRAIADHLKLANWKVELGPPLEAHGMNERLRQGWREEQTGGTP